MDASPTPGTPAAPAPMLGQLYTVGSLANTPDGVRFSIKNRLFDASLTRILSAAVDDAAVDLATVGLLVGGREVLATDVVPNAELPFQLRNEIDVVLTGHAPLAPGDHTIACDFTAEPFGDLAFRIS